MRIEVENLTPGGEPFEHTYAEGELSLGDEEDARLLGDATVAGRASRKGEEINLRGEIRATVEAACDRCLRPVTLPLELEFRESLMPFGAETVSKEETVLQSADLHYSVYEGDEIDVDELVREQVLLALPIRLVCRDDCKGLCPSCGADLNAGPCSCPREEVDPRWAALAALKNEKT